VNALVVVEADLTVDDLVSDLPPGLLSDLHTFFRHHERVSDRAFGLHRHHGRFFAARSLISSEVGMISVAARTSTAGSGPDPRCSVP